MRKAILLFLTASAFAATGFAQRQAPANDLARAGAVFRTADANHNGVLSIAEAQRQGVARAQFQAFDDNADGQIDQNEFMVAFRRLTMDQGERVSADLDKEVTRIMAARKAAAEKRAAEERAQAERLKKARQKDARQKGTDKPAERPPIRKLERVPKRPAPAPVQRPTQRGPRG